MDGEIAVVALQRMVEIDDAAHERGREDPDAAEIEQVDGAVRCGGVVAKMRIAMNDAVMVERHVPHPEHSQGSLVAHCKRCPLYKIEDRHSFEPGHRQQATGRKVG